MMVIVVSERVRDCSGPERVLAEHRLPGLVISGMVVEGRGRFMGSREAGGMQSLRVETLRQACDIYLSHAYAGVEPPVLVSRRLEWPPTDDIDELLNRPPFERGEKAKGTSSPIYALRLGNHAYPHMKLQIQPWPSASGYMLSVNTHDQVLSLEPNAHDMPAFRVLQEENKRLKEAIEQAWDDAGLPTFLRYLREYIEHRGTGKDDAPAPG